MRVRDYSEAVLGLVKDGMSVDAALQGLHTMLDARGHARLLPKILRDLLIVSAKETAHESAVVTVARKEDEAKFKKEIDTHLETLKVSLHDVHIDENIVGGFTIDAHEKRIDQSYKKRLLTLYRSLIKS
jgi:F0F1-type ATP synthase delta subunit